MTTTQPMTDAHELADRLFDGFATVTEHLSLHLGTELGLVDALAEGPLTASELADRAGVDARYAREWLEQLAVGGYLTCEDPSAGPDQRRFGLPAALAEVLTDDSSDAYMRPLMTMLGSVASVIRDVTTAFRTGGGIPYHAYPEVRRGLDEMNGAAYDTLLGEWIATMPDIHHALTTATDPRILDLGCGTGRSTVALARAYPRATVRGIDLDRESIDLARETTAAAGLAHRVTFAHHDAASAEEEGRYHLVTLLEALHDMGDPIGALRRAHDQLAPGGAVFVADQRCPDHFAPNGSVIERFQYGASVHHCLPATMAEHPVIAHGTVLRAPTVEAWARAAGYDDVDRLPIDNPFWQMYRLS